MSVVFVSGFKGSFRWYDSWYQRKPSRFLSQSVLLCHTAWEGVGVQTVHGKEVITHFSDQLILKIFTSIITSSSQHPVNVGGRSETILGSKNYMYIKTIHKTDEQFLMTIFPFVENLFFIRRAIYLYTFEEIFKFSQGFLPLYFL